MKILKTVVFLSSVLVLSSCKSIQIELMELRKNNQELRVQNIILKDSLYLLAYRKNDSIKAVVSLDRFKTVYRGIGNSITIIVPNAVKTTVVGSGLEKMDGIGHYILKPGAGNETELKIKAVMPDGSIYEESKVLKIKNINAEIAYIDNYYWNSPVMMKLEGIINAKINVKISDFVYEFSDEVTGFTVVFPDNKSISVEGNMMNEEVKKKLRGLKPNDILKISEIRTVIRDQAIGLLPALNTILIKLMA